MKLQNLTIIFIIIIIPIILVLSAYIGYEIKTINKQNTYNTGLISATHDAIISFETNTKNDDYNNNAELKRSNIKSAVKTFENSLSTTCNLGLYNNEEIEEYIPAIVFGLYDGFYMYAPSENQDGEYKHNLRNYVYYSEELKDTDIVIRYSLDNYVAVSGTINGIYQTNAGYLINENEWELLKGTSDEPANKYYNESMIFTNWFNTNISSKIDADYLKIDDGNDPEDEDSPFVQHKRQIMKQKIEETLNSSITAYSNKSRNNYKMPKFSEEDWEKIYTNISVISFVQGMNLGFKDYNNYCILNSTNNQEYVNPNLIYFTDGREYHDIRCDKINNVESTGYKIGDFEKLTRNVKNEDGEITGTEYYYKHNETACYECINGSLNKNISIYDYVRDLATKETVKKSYFTALARERYNTTKLSDALSMNKNLYSMCQEGVSTKEDVVNMLEKIHKQYNDGITIKYKTWYGNQTYNIASYNNYAKDISYTSNPSSIILFFDSSSGNYLIEIK